MTQGQIAAAEDNSAADDPAQAAYYERIEQLYTLYEDWTGTQEDDTDETDRSGRLQSDGSPVIDVGTAASTFFTFVVQIANDAGVTLDDFKKIAESVYAGLEEEDDEDDGDDEDDEGDAGDEDEDEEEEEDEDQTPS